MKIPGMLFGCVAALAASVASAAGTADDVLRTVDDRLDACAEEGGIAIPPKPATSDGQIVVFENVAMGRISPQNGVCGAPDKLGTPNFAAWKAAAFPYSRTHDLNLCATYGSPYVIDVPWIFRDFDADETDPRSYDFACTDAILLRIREAGVEPFYRLGGAYESYLVKHYNVFPPKDFAKWARVCEHIIAHYTEGWADGFTWKMEHWEIWNEPDLATGPGGKMNRFWIGPRDQFKELWKTAQKHLKARFPHLKFGGAAFAGTGGDWGAAMVKEFASEKIPLDFYSWHAYETNPSVYGEHARWVRTMLDVNGYTNALSVVDEWNYVKGWDVHALGGYSRNVWLGDKNDKCAAFIAASMVELDAAGADIGMFYDARNPGMNALFNSISGQPMRGYYPFIAWRNLRRLGTRVKTTSEFKNGVWTVAARGADRKLGILVVNYTDDDNAFRPKRVTVRLASGKSLKQALCHLTDRNFIYTAYDPEPNADGSIDLTMSPCSFVYIDVES